MTRRSRSALMALAVGVTLAGAAHARGQQPASRLLDGVTGLSCTFPLLTTGNWEAAGDAKAETAPAQLKVVFTAIDTQDGTAEVQGDVGASTIVVRNIGDYLHLMQLKSTGPIYLTSVFARESRPGKLKAAHTRHEYTDTKLTGYTWRPEQYYGECEVKK